jgi:hypothetical protein
MKQRFHKRKAGQRWQAERAFSRHLGGTVVTHL